MSDQCLPSDELVQAMTAGYALERATALPWSKLPGSWCIGVDIGVGVSSMAATTVDASNIDSVTKDVEKAILAALNIPYKSKQGDER
jgi:hypothetical protein